MLISSIIITVTAICALTLYKLRGYHYTSSSSPKVVIIPQRPAPHTGFEYPVIGDVLNGVMIMSEYQATGM